MLFDFKCSNGHVFESNVPSDVRHSKCPDCSAPANRLISAPALKIPFTGDYPGAAFKWARHHEKGSNKYN